MCILICLRELLDSVIKAHGGLQRWSRVKSISVTFNIRGALLSLKGYPKSYRPTFTADVSKPKAVIQRLGDANPDDRWHFEQDRVWVEQPDGTIASDRSEVRVSFQGHTYSTPWDHLHLAYFIEYAMWDYLTTPFIFTWPGFKYRELGLHQEDGETWRVLEVTFPDGFPAHTQIQKFYFDSKDFMLRRGDYTTDVLGGVAAHYCYDYKEIDGIWFPTFRRVVKRNPDGSTRIHGPSAFILDYVSVAVCDKE
jgi:hypothetical protein